MENLETRIAQIIPALEYLYSARQIEKLSSAFLMILHSYSYVREIQNKAQLEKFLYFFLETFSSERFFIPENHKKEYIAKNDLIAQLAAFSSVKSTDAFLLPLLPPDKQKLVKVLTLYSAASKIRLDYHALFSLDKNLVSEWYWNFFKYKNYINPGVLENFNRHIDFLADYDDISVPNQPSAAFYLSTYINNKKDRLVKQRINRLIRQAVSDIKIDNRPDKKKIAILSELFFEGHAVHKGTYRFIEALAGEFDLFLYHLGKPMPNLVFPGIFKEIYYLPVSPRNLKHSLLRLLNNDYGMVIFPDAGMSASSVYLSNIRFAPVQIAMHGHSVSSWGAETDYFISGYDSEIPGRGQENYSEKLLLLPGLGLVSDYPGFPAVSRTKPEKFIVTCSWSLQKIRYEHLLLLREIAGKSSKKLLFRFFCSIRSFFTEVVKEEIGAVLGAENIEVIGFITYSQYLEQMSETHMALDSFPFGGYNTINDALYLRLPAITLQGGHAYNRFAGALLKKAGLAELVADSPAAYVEKSLKLINDDDYRESIVRYLERLNLSEQMNIKAETGAFLAMVKQIMNSDV